MGIGVRAPNISKQIPGSLAKIIKTESNGGLDTPKNDRRHSFVNPKVDPDFKNIGLYIYICIERDRETERERTF